MVDTSLRAMVRLAANKELEMKLQNLFATALLVTGTFQSSFGLTVTLESTMSATSVQATLERLLAEAHKNGDHSVSRTADGSYVVRDSDVKLTCQQFPAQAPPGLAAPTVQYHRCTLETKATE